MNTQKGSVLIVEDNDLERQSLATLLRVENYEVHTAASTEEALGFVNDDIDVVLSDLRMHGQNGVDLLRQWKAQRPSTPFIFVTGVVDIAHVVEAVKLGAEDYITKPFRSADLLARIAECVDARHESAYRGNGQAPSLASHDYNDVLEIPASATMEEIERIAIESALSCHGDNRTHAAEALGISVRTLQRKLKAWAAAGA